MLATSCWGSVSRRKRFTVLFCAAMRRGRVRRVALRESMVVVLLLVVVMMMMMLGLNRAIL
jgi:hypothetical protein